MAITISKYRENIRNNNKQLKIICKNYFKKQKCLNKINYI